MQVGEEVLAADHTGFERDQQVSRFGHRSVVSVDHDARAADRDVVQFTRGGLKRSNRIDVRSLAKHVAVEERGLRGGAGAEDIGFGGAGT